jgi:hypothetical protein
MSDLTTKVKTLLDGSPPDGIHILCDCDGLCAHDEQNRNLLRLKNLAPQLATAYLALVKRVEAADKLAEAIRQYALCEEGAETEEDYMDVFNNWDELEAALAEYREAEAP